MPRREPRGARPPDRIAPRRGRRAPRARGIASRSPAAPHARRGPAVVGRDRDLHGPLPGPAIDLSLLHGFRFTCRPGCGLCCYATPAASPSEQQTLLRLDPSVRFVGGSGAFRLVPSRPDGGACRFLVSERCTVHSARPFPCREYPLSIHVGEDWQASLVLTCPGVTAAELARWGQPGLPAEPPEGLAEELDAMTGEAAKEERTRYEAAARRWRRALRSEGVPRSPSALADLRRSASDLGTFPTDDDLSSIYLPEASDGLALLPLYFDPQFGRVALAASDEGVELLQLRETGGIQEVLGRYAAPTQLPRMDPEARATLEGYLGYVLRRDAFLGSGTGSESGGGPRRAARIGASDRRR